MHRLIAIAIASANHRSALSRIHVLQSVQLGLRLEGSTGFIDDGWIAPLRDNRYLLMLLPRFDITLLISWQSSLASLDVVFNPVK